MITHSKSKVSVHVVALVASLALVVVATLLAPQCHCNDDDTHTAGNHSKPSGAHHRQLEEIFGEGQLARSLSSYIDLVPGGTHKTRSHASESSSGHLRGLVDLILARRVRRCRRKFCPPCPPSRPCPKCPEDEDCDKCPSCPAPPTCPIPPPTSPPICPTAAPCPTCPPDVTEQPPTTQRPSPTPEPQPTSAPQSTPKPQPTSIPTPEPTAEPRTTQEPQPTTGPQPTPLPLPTVAPLPTAEPQPTAEPKPTQEPQTTAQPQPTSEPQPSRPDPRRPDPIWTWPSAPPRPTKVPGRRKRQVEAVATSDHSLPPAILKDVAMYMYNEEASGASRGGLEPDVSSNERLAALKKFIDEIDDTSAAESRSSELPVGTKTQRFALGGSNSGKGIRMRGAELFNRYLKVLVPEKGMRKSIIRAIDAMPDNVGGGEARMAHQILAQFGEQLEEPEPRRPYERRATFGTARSNVRRILGHIMHAHVRRRCRRMFPNLCTPCFVNKCPCRRPRKCPKPDSKSKCKFCPKNPPCPGPQKCPPPAKCPECKKKPMTTTTPSPSPSPEPSSTPSPSPSPGPSSSPSPGPNQTPQPQHEPEPQPPPGPKPSPPDWPLTVDDDDTDPVDTVRQEELTEPRPCKGFSCAFQEQCGAAPLNPLTPAANANRSHGYITSGENASYGEWPSLVRLDLTLRTRLASGLCAGVLISDRHVLTAGHCTMMASQGRTRSSERRRGSSRGRKKIGRGNRREHGGQKVKPEEISVVLGDHLRHSSDKFERKHNVSSVCYAKKYQFGNKGARYDFSILTLKEKVEFNKHVQPACLPYKQLDLANNRTKCWAVGIGVTQYDKSQTFFPNHKFAEVVQKLQLNQVGCGRWNIKDDDRSRQCWARANKRGGDTCAGDSGGPVLCLSPDEKRWTVMGLVSYGSTACDGTDKHGWVAVYTRVQALLKHMNEECGI